MDFKKAALPVLYVLILASCLTLIGCATDPSPKLKDDIVSLKRQVWSLEKQTAEVNLRLARNSDEVSLLGEKVKRLEDAVNSLKESVMRSSGPKISFFPVQETAESVRAGEVTQAQKPAEFSRN